MMKQSILPILIACLFCLALCRPAQANTREHLPVDTLPAQVGLAAISDLYNLMGDFSGQVTRVTKLQSVQGNRTDSATGTFKVKSPAYLVQFDSLVQLQNTQYHVLVDHGGDAISLRKKQPVRVCLWQLDLLNAEFLRNYVKTMYLLDTGSLKKIKVVFNAGTPYQDYEMIYNPQTYLPVTVKCVYYYNDGSASGGQEVHCWRFSGFSTSPLPADTFLSDKFFRKVNGAYQLTAPYTHYQFGDYSTLY